MPMSATETMQEFALPYGQTVERSTDEPKGFFSARYVVATSITCGPSDDLEALRNGPIVLSDAAAVRLGEVIAEGRKPLPAPPATRSDTLQAR
jgi:hypothetical protein